jgi:hypothetical protein
MSKLRLLVVVLLSFVLPACLEQVGGEGQQCNNEGLCQPGFVCNEDNVCEAGLAGSLVGYVFLEGQNEHSGSTVTLQDTTHSTSTDTDGRWSIEQVKTGTHAVVASHYGYIGATLADQRVVANKVTNVPNIVLKAAECTPENASEVCGARPCVDGYCCDRACSGKCETCDGASTNAEPGTCGYIIEGKDPAGECEELGECAGNCDGAGSCRIEPCDDGLFCNGTDTCDTLGRCTIHSGDPCIHGGECDNQCNEEAENCYVPAGTPCDDDLFCNRKIPTTAMILMAHHVVIL